MQTASLDQTTLERIDGFWARRLGCEVAQLRTPGLHTVVRSVSRAPRGVHALARDGVLVLAGARDAVDRLAARLHGRSALPTAPLLHDAYGSVLECVIGPAFLGYRKTAPELPSAALEARPLAAEEHAALRRLRDAVGDEAWRHAGLRMDRSGAGPIFGAFADGQLLAAASFEVLLGSVASLAVATHPAARARGAGRRAVAAAAGAAAERGLLLQYQTLESNLPSLRLAASLGFGAYGRSLALRLAGEASPLR